MERIHKEAAISKAGTTRQERMKKERKKIQVGDCTLWKDTHSILEQATKEERQTSYSNASSDEYSPLSETCQRSRRPRRCTRKV